MLEAFPHWLELTPGETETKSTPQCFNTTNNLHMHLIFLYVHCIINTSG